MRYPIPKATTPDTKLMRFIAIATVSKALGELSGDERYTVRIERHKDRRTLEQNSKFHAMASELAEVLGYTQEELKRAVKKELGYYAIVDGRLGKAYRWESSATWDTEKLRAGKTAGQTWAICRTVRKLKKRQTRCWPCTVMRSIIQTRQIKGLRKFMYAKTDTEAFAQPRSHGMAARCRSET